MTKTVGLLEKVHDTHTARLSIGMRTREKDEGVVKVGGGMATAIETVPWLGHA